MSGNIYVTDGPNSVYKSRPDGTFAVEVWQPGDWYWGSLAAPDFKLGPWAWPWNDAGDIYVADPENHRIQIFAEAHSVLTIDNVTVTEGNTGTTPAVFTVTLTPASSQTVTVDYATADQSAQAGTDYTSRKAP